MSAWSGMRVALVHDWLNGMRGGEKVLEAICELFPQAPIYTLFCVRSAISERLRQHPIHTSPIQRRPLVERYYRYYLPQFPAAIESFDLTGYDLIISTSHCVAKGVIPAPHAVHLSYCHSPMRYAWDQQHQYFPGRGPVAGVRNMLLSRLRTWDVAACPRVDHFWANSSFVAKRIERYYHRQAEVIAPPIDVDFFAPDTGGAQTGGNDVVSAAEGDGGTRSEGDFALAVSALVPYKRLDRAITACRRSGLELRIVGSGPEHARLSKLCGEGCRLLGRVDEHELRRLYQQARLFLQPGVEDFGMAPVEAMAAGTPTVAVGRGGVLDIVRNGEHGVLTDDDEVESLASAIDKCMNISFNKLELKHRAESFSHPRFIRQLTASIERQLQVSSESGREPWGSARTNSR